MNARTIVRFSTPRDVRQTTWKVVHSLLFLTGSFYHTILQRSTTAADLPRAPVTTHIMAIKAGAQQQTLVQQTLETTIVPILLYSKTLLLFCVRDGRFCCIGLLFLAWADDDSEAKTHKTVFRNHQRPLGPTILDWK